MWMSPPVMDFAGGAYILRTDIWHEIGGFDEEFTGYGAEDDAFHVLCTSRLGRISFVPGINYHLYHPAYRVTSLENYQRLVTKYNMHQSRVHKIIKDLS
jgi:predicted glycosyltransferase involved in capsule biosynthesis